MEEILKRKISDQQSINKSLQKKEMLEEFDKEMLGEKLMKMPELENSNVVDDAETRIINLQLQYESLQNAYERLKKEHQENIFETTKRLNDINTFQCCEGELCLRGTDELGKDFTVWFDAYNFLDWIDTEQIKYIKEQIIKHVESK